MHRSQVAPNHGQLSDSVYILPLELRLHITTNGKTLVSIGPKKSPDANADEVFRMHQRNSYKLRGFNG